MSQRGDKCVEEKAQFWLLGYSEHSECLWMWISGVKGSYSQTAVSFLSIAAVRKQEAIQCILQQNLLDAS